MGLQEQQQRQRFSTSHLYYKWTSCFIFFKNQKRIPCHKTQDEKEEKEKKKKREKESIQTDKAQTKQRKKEQLQTHQDYSIELSAFRMTFKRNFL